MAWLQLRGGVWWIGYRIEGKQHRQSTGYKDESKAKEVLEQYELMERAHKSKKLTDGFYRALTGNVLPMVSLRDALQSWLDEVRKTTTQATYDHYTSYAEKLMVYLKADQNLPLLSQVTAQQVSDFLHALQLSPGTTNLIRRSLSAFFNRAIRMKLITENPVLATKAVPVRRKDRARRPFTMDELSKVASRAADSVFWRYMILGGIYTGLRMGDLICLRRAEVNLKDNRLEITTSKTGATLRIPMAKPFRSVVEERFAQMPETFDRIWPDRAEIYKKQGSSPFSIEFNKKILKPAGLASSKGELPNGRRATNPLSFHSLRHSFVSMLQASGASKAIARELAGHASEQVNDLYTHTEFSALEKAVMGLPEIG